MAKVGAATKADRRIIDIRGGCGPRGDMGSAQSSKVWEGLLRPRADKLLVRSKNRAALADRLTVSRKWVNEIEQGNANAKLGLVLRALNELQIDIAAHAGPQSLPAGPQHSDEIDIDVIVDQPISRAP